VKPIKQGAKEALVAEWDSISCSGCWVFRCWTVSFLYLVHMFLPATQYIGRQMMPLACSS
jgi:hypothetical protein